LATQKIPLEGQLTEVERKRVDIDLVLLDIENPRVQYTLDARIFDTVTQDDLINAISLGGDQYKKLKENIELNGGIINPIWVVEENDMYRVIEGNCRVVVYKELKEEQWNNIKWREIDSYVLPQAVDRAKINFIRLEAHLFGTTPWDAYEKAKELHRLYSEEDYSVTRLEQLTKLKANDIKTNIQAFKDMEDQYLPKYSNPGEQLKFSYFAEFRKSKGLRELLRSKELSVEQFCDLVGQNRFGRGEQVRKLSEVWADPASREALVNENMEAALEQLSLINPAAKSKLFEKIADVTLGLERLPFSEIDEIKCGYNTAKANELRSLHNVLTKLLDGMGMLNNG